MIRASISVPDQGLLVQRLFAAEEQRFVNERASYKVQHYEGISTIEVRAQDATALRAVLNSVCKTLIVFEKAGAVVEDAK